MTHHRLASVALAASMGLFQGCSTPSSGCGCSSGLGIGNGQLLARMGFGRRNDCCCNGTVMSSGPMASGPICEGTLMSNGSACDGPMLGTPPGIGIAPMPYPTTGEPPVVPAPLPMVPVPPAIPTPAPPNGTAAARAK